ncbi:MAG: MaoC family dehydratase [Acidimicrobiales bacterium]
MNAELRHFEDLAVGDAADLGSTSVSEAEIIEFASKYDPQWFHLDPVAAGESIYGGLIASGWHSCAILMRLAVDSWLNRQAGLGSPGLDELRFKGPVRPGDTLRGRIEILELVPSASKPDRGLVRSRMQLFNQRDEEVLSMISLGLVRRRGSELGRRA